MATTNTLTMAQAVKLLKEAGVPYGGQAGSQLKNWESISSYVGANLLSSGGTPVATASYDTSVKRTVKSDKVIGTVVDASGKAIKGDTTFASAGTTTGGGGAPTYGPTGGGAGGSGTGGAFIGGTNGNDGGGGGGTGGGAATTTKGTDYQMADERRLSGLELDQYRNFYSRMKGGRAAPSAALLAPYRGYGGPRSTQIGNSNTQTATKMLLGQ